MPVRRMPNRTMRLMMDLGLGLASSLLAASCTSLPFEPDSPVARDLDWGIAGGESAEEVELLIGVVETVLPVYRSLPGFVDSPLRIHIAEDVGFEFRDGLTVRMFLLGQWIIIRRESEDVPSVIAHEMAHYYFQDYQELFPPVLEEGICDILASLIYEDRTDKRTQIIVAMVSYIDELDIEVNGPASKKRIAQLMLDAPSIEEFLEYRWDELLDASPTNAQRIYGVGRMLAQVIGLEGLDQLAIRCGQEELDRVPIEWILEAAGLVPMSQENLISAFGRALNGEGFSADGSTMTIELSD
jgi:hypothetical protein